MIVVFFAIILKEWLVAFLAIFVPVDQLDQLLCAIYLISRVKYIYIFFKWLQISNEGLYFTSL